MVRFRDHGVGITREDYLSFFHLLNNINDVDTALTFYHIAGASIDQPTLRHVARTVARVDLHPHLVNVVFTIFDENSEFLIDIYLIFDKDSEFFITNYLMFDEDSEFLLVVISCLTRTMSFHCY